MRRSKKSRFQIGLSLRQRSPLQDGYGFQCVQGRKIIRLIGVWGASFRCVGEGGAKGIGPIRCRDMARPDQRMCIGQNLRMPRLGEDFAARGKRVFRSEQNRAPKGPALRCHLDAHPAPKGLAQ